MRTCARRSYAYTVRRAYAMLACLPYLPHPDRRLATYRLAAGCERRATGLHVRAVSQFAPGRPGGAHANWQQISYRYPSY